MKMNRIVILFGFFVFVLVLFVFGVWVMNVIDGYICNYYWMYFGGLVLFFVILLLFGIVRVVIGIWK